MRRKMKHPHLHPPFLDNADNATLFSRKLLSLSTKSRWIWSTWWTTFLHEWRIETSMMINLRTLYLWNKKDVIEILWHSLPSVTGAICRSLSLPLSSLTFEISRRHDIIKAILWRQDLLFSVCSLSLSSLLSLIYICIRDSGVIGSCPGRSKASLSFLLLRVCFGCAASLSAFRINVIEA